MAINGLRSLYSTQVYVKLVPATVDVHQSNAVLRDKDFSLVRAKSCFARKVAACLYKNTVVESDNIFFFSYRKFIIFNYFNHFISLFQIFILL